MAARLRTWTARLGAVAITLALAPAAHAVPDRVLPEGSAEHYAGSQIAKHEGRGRSGASRPRQNGAVPGMDVSSHQGDVDWDRAWADGARFAYVKATEGTGYRNPNFGQQYDGSYRVGMVRGAYHFALPDRSDGAAQADFFADNGAGWSPDGKTLPGAVDLEYNPYGDTCYGLSQEAMGGWVKAFSDRLVQRTGRHPTIYTSTSWWNLCVGKTVTFGATNPLWVAHYNDQLGPLPNGWDRHAIWQWQAAGLFPGDQNLFNGDSEQLRGVALG
ncbi:GH25 family lysozyme M1 (1,4-beta-N-acetylmuramidase) [Saccharothrix tamanrassetensis]|uniref:Lysozyme n=1 Tax=Saccharothrix tamanrassetensis TaxID=1051531 RepID=A0A841CEW5_9PSEU|nr:lysozyme [Saccharothrix tamanrassetensis]MBB5954555.1 GH25 family lysozyme M1 (1,4-beta-N-acetylmuramidase) [Saccharothrix tamanrassetensis]